MNPHTDIEKLENRIRELEKENARLKQDNAALRNSQKDATSGHEIDKARFESLKSDYKQLKRQEERFLHAIQGGKRGVWEWEIENNEFYLSSMCKKMLGYDETLPVHSLEDWLKWVHADDLSILKSQLERIKNADIDHFSCEYRMKHQSGTFLWISTKGKLIGKEAKRLVGTNTNINERKQVEEALKENEEKFRLIFEESPIGIILYDSKAHTLQINREARLIFGVRKNQIIENVNLFKDLGFTGKMRRNLEKYNQIRFERRFHLDVLKKNYPYIQKTGEKILDVKIATLKNSRKLHGHQYIFQVDDITEYRLAEEALLQNEMRSRSLLNAIPDLMFRFSNKGKCLDYNFASASSFFLINEDFIYSPIEKIFPPRFAKMFKKYLDQTLKRAAIHIFEWDHNLPDYQSFEIRMVPCGNNEVIVIFRDITRSRLMTRKLEENESRLKYAQEIANQGIIDYNFKENHTVFSDELLNILDYHAVNKLKDIRAYEKFIHPDDRIRMRMTYLNSVKNHQGYDMNYRLHLQSGQIKYVREICHNAYDDKGRPERSMRIIQDITSRKAMEEALRLSEEKYFRLFNSMNTSLVAFRLLPGGNDLPQKFIIENINSACERLLDVRREDIINKEAFEVYPYLDSNFKEIVQQVGKTGESVTFIHYAIISQRYLEITIYKTHENKYAALLDEVTESVLAAQSLTRSEQQHRSLTENMEDMVLRFDTELKLIFHNRPSKKFLFQGNDDFLYRKFDDIGLSANIVRSLRSMIQKSGTIRAKVGRYLKYKSSRKNHVLDWRIIPEYNSVGRIMSYLCVVRDITHEHQTRQALKEAKRKAEQSEKHYRNLIQAADDRIVLFSSKSGIILANSAYYEQLGYTEKEYLYHMQNGGHEMNIEPYSEDMLDSVLNKGRSDLEYRIKNKHGQWQFMNARFVLIEKLKDEAIILGIIRDVTRMKEFEKELIRSKEKAEESDWLKSAFLANMSHEIRTPLNGILGFVKLLNNPRLNNEKRKRYQEIIFNNANQLLAIISDIIDIAKIEGNQLEIFRESIRLNRVMRDLLETYTRQAMKRGKDNVEIRLRNPLDDQYAIIDTDPVRFQQIMDNLLNNALKFTDHGYVEFGYDIHNENEILIFVKDTGIGIAKEKQRIIFDRFRQEDDSSTRIYGGTGLGLAITYQLVHLLGGDIWVESDKNTGSVFFFTLPFKVNPGVHYEKEFINEEKPLKRMQSWKGKKILLVDDVLHVYEYLQALLDQTGVQISYVNSGAKAIRFMRRYKDIDLILLDIQMPEMNGIKVAEEIRKIDPDVPIIAQSANALKGDKERYLKKGCHDYISKPIEPELLFQKMNKYLSVPIKR